jgi:hypothetical protein
MARRHHLSQAVSGSPNGRRLGASPVRSRKIDFNHALTAWIGAVVLVVNLFGWTLTSLPDASPQSTADAAENLFDDAPMCEHAADHHTDRGDNKNTDHGKMVCPACFPLGNASSGALVSAPPTALVAVDSLIVERIRPDDWIAPSSFVPHRYQARAPPQFA